MAIDNINHMPTDNDVQPATQTKRSSEAMSQ